MAPFSPGRRRQGGTGGAAACPASPDATDQAEAEGGSSGAAHGRFALFNPVSQFDPRSRSLPYLLRQAEEARQQEEGQQTPASAPLPVQELAGADTIFQAQGTPRRDFEI
jgi:hypothetical protein